MHTRKYIQAARWSRVQDDVISIMAYQKRLKKEYEELSKRAPVGVSLDGNTMEDNVDV